MKKILILFGFALTATFVSAQNFDTYFEDNTLRLDYILSGDTSSQSIQLERLVKQPRWAGRKARLAETFLKGDGQLYVRDHATGTLLYTHTFSTLFREWLLYAEAQHTRRAFENTFLVPFPKQKVDITLNLTDSHQKVIASITHTVDPADILIRHLGFSENARMPYRYTHLSGNITDCVDIALVAEGYTAAEMDKFYKDAERATEALLGHEPFTQLKNKFNIVAVATPSEVSGPSIPHEGVWHNTAVNTHYDTFYMQRYLTTSEVHHLYDLTAGIPLEQVIILVNTSIYGGGGIYNQWMTCAADHATFKQVLVHEFGHSYAGLADEYDYGESTDTFYPADVEPWEPNITTLKDFSLKWADMLPAGIKIPTPPVVIKGYEPKKPCSEKVMKKVQQCTSMIGVYEGAGYQTTGAYRPAPLCRMKVNEVENFCPVCTRAIHRITDFYTAK